MIVTTNDLLEEFKDYKDIYGKIKRMLDAGEYISIIKGLYETVKTTPGYYLSAYIYGPSYLSFDYALAYHNLIPEAVYNYTCATFNKRKTKKYNTYFGVYIYTDIPKNVYSYGVSVYEENGYSFQIASPEKALCDKLYSLSPLKNINELKTLLFDDLRINSDAFIKLNKDDILIIAPKYRSTNLNLLLLLIKELL